MNTLTEFKHQIPKSAKLQIEEHRPIIALETTQVKENQKDFNQFKEKKSAYTEKTFNDTFLRAISISEAACKINISIYILMMGLGASLILDAIILSALNGVGLFSSILAVVGVASLVSILLISPQSKITKNAAKSLQYQILYSGFVNQLKMLKKSDTYEIETSVGDVERMSLRLEQLTFNTAERIEKMSDAKPQNS